MLGNDAAARKAREDIAAYHDVIAMNSDNLISDRSPAGDVPYCQGFKNLGSFRITDGPVIGVRVATDFDIHPLKHILFSLSTKAPSEQRLDYVLTHGRRHLLRVNEQVVLDGAFCDGRPGQDINNNPFIHLMSELLLRLLSHVPLMVVLHASAVAWRGKRIVFVGASGSGKSTIAAALVGSANAAYLADDITPITRSGDIIPVPLAPSIKQGAWPLVYRLFPQLREATTFLKGGQSLKYLVDAPYAERGGPPDLIVFPTFSEAREPKAARLTEIEVLLQMSQTMPWVAPENLDPFLDMLGGLPAIAMRHGPDIEQTVALLEAHLEARV